MLGWIKGMDRRGLGRKMLIQATIGIAILYTYKLVRFYIIGG